MRIGLIGWYGHQNAGDDRILYCLERFFSEHQIIATSGLDDALNRIDIINQCDFVLMGGGGLVLRGWNKFLPLLEQIKPRFGCVGISIEAKHKDNIQFIKALLAKSEFVLVRDRQSKELLGNHYKVIVGPDLTFLYPFDILDEIKEETCGLNLRPWYYWNSEHGGLYYRLMNNISSRFSRSKDFYPFSKWEPKDVFESVIRNFSSVVPIPLYTENHQTNDLTLMKSFFPNEMECSFSPSLYSNCRYIVGMRLHSLIFACQMGIPFVSLSYQPKNIEFCKLLGSEKLSVGLFESGMLPHSIEYMKDFYADIREGLLEFRNSNSKEISYIMNNIKKLIV